MNWFYSWFLLNKVVQWLDNVVSNHFPSFKGDVQPPFQIIDSAQNPKWLKRDQTNYFWGASLGTHQEVQLTCFNLKRRVLQPGWLETFTDLGFSKSLTLWYPVKSNKRTWLIFNKSHVNSWPCLTLFLLGGWDRLKCGTERVKQCKIDVHLIFMIKADLE